MSASNAGSGAAARDRLIEAGEEAVRLLVKSNAYYEAQMAGRASEMIRDTYLDAFLAHRADLSEVMGLEQVGWYDNGGEVIWKRQTIAGPARTPVFAFRLGDDQ
jgi:hypothetical protein